MALEKINEQPQVEKIEMARPSPEKINNSENKTEHVLTTSPKTAESVKIKPKSPMVVTAVSATIPDWEQKQMAAIDGILAEGLNEVFLKMSPREQRVFKNKGEETVKKIDKILNKTKVKVNKIIELIKSWLKCIPGINHFFLEQEAKIKADRIVKIKDRF